MRIRKKTNAKPKNGVYSAEPTQMVLEEMESYCTEHPGSPSAVRRPALSFRSGLWIALLGPSVEGGIVGIGSTVKAALRAFDTQYLAGLHPPTETIRTRQTFAGYRLSPKYALEFRAEV